MEPISIPAKDPHAGLVTRRIHIMGLGSIGTFIAHSLRAADASVPLTLLMHRRSMYDAFEAHGRSVSVVGFKSSENVPTYGYDVDLREEGGAWRFIADDSREYGQHDRSDDEVLQDSGESYIHNLIVTVKGPATRAALESVKHRLDQRSTVCLVQNGMGQVDELNAQVFTDPKSRPSYLLGIIAYGVYLKSDKLEAVHAGSGTTSLSVVRDIKSDTEEFAELQPSALYMLQTLAAPPVFESSAYRFQDLLQLQLQKLCMNAVMNPLTALLDVRNGYLLGNEPLAHVHTQLLTELSSVIRALPEFERADGIQARFSVERLQELLTDVSTKTARNSSSMREDVVHEKDTEIEYINGYIVRRGKELGIECPYNRMLLQLVKAKTQAQRAMKQDGAG